MSSVNLYNASRSYIVRRIALEVIKNIKRRSLEEYKEKNSIHADLVPRVVDGKKPSILEKEKQKIKNYPIALKESKFPLMKKFLGPMFAEPKVLPAITPLDVQKPVLDKPKAPKIEVKVTPKVETPKPAAKQNKVALPPAKKVVPVKSDEIKPKSTVPLKPSYGKLIPLLMDPQVLVIECGGADKPLQVMAGGQRHVTNLTLSEEEIDAILQKVSQEVHIPLLEGVFKAVHDKFFINAVVSKMVGSKFVIRKQSQMFYQGRGA